MTPKDFAERMKAISDGDPEEDGRPPWRCDVHPEMDQLMVAVLRSLGYGEGCDIFEAEDKWYD